MFDHVYPNLCMHVCVECKYVAWYVERKLCIVLLCHTFEGCLSVQGQSGDYYRIC